MDFSKIAKLYTRKEFINLLEETEYGEKSLILKDDKGGFVYCPSHLGLKTVIDCKAERDTCSICWLNAIKDVKFKDEIQENKNTELSKVNNIKLNKELWNDILLGKGKLMLLETEYKNFYDYIMVNKKLLKDLDNNCINTYIANSVDNNIYMLYKTQSENRIILYSELFIEDIPISTTKEYTASQLIHMIEEDKLNTDDIIIDMYNNKNTIFNLLTNKTMIGFINAAPYKIKKYEPKYVTFDEAVKSGKKIKYKNLMDFYNIKDLIKKIIHVYNTDTIKKILEEKAWIIEE